MGRHSFPMICESSYILRNSAAFKRIRRLWRSANAFLRIETRILVLVALMSALGLLLFLHIASEVGEGETMAFDRTIFCWRFACLAGHGNQSDPHGSLMR